MAAVRRFRSAVERFSILASLADFAKLIGWLLIIIGGALFVWSLYVFFAAYQYQGGGLLSLLGSGFFLISIGVIVVGGQLVMFGEIVGVFFSIEENTYKTAELLDDMEFDYRRRLGSEGQGG